MATESSKSSSEFDKMLEKIDVNVKQQLAELFKKSFQATFPSEADVQPVIAVSKKEFGDYQCGDARRLYHKVRKAMPEFSSPTLVGEAIIKNLPKSEMIESCSVTGQGFVNVVLPRTWVVKTILKMLVEGIQTWAPKLSVKRVALDFSSPNIAKEMHVGHLRSTILGDTLANLLEFCGVEVLRINHIGDWGTQFGMLIEFLFEQFPHWEDADEVPPIKDLQELYRESNTKFKEDAIFKEKARKAVVRLQGGDIKYRKAWALICEISRREFQKVYERLRVHIEEKGESFYNPYIPTILEDLRNKGLIEVSDGAQVIRINGKKAPLIVVKSDGGFNYDSTDLVALWYRLNEENADWIIYVTDVGQRDHFEKFFDAAKQAGWLPDDKNAYPKATHVGFGFVLGDDGKRLSTRDSEVVRLVELLDEAKHRSKQALIQRGKAVEWTEEELEQTAEAVGYGAVKFFDMRNNRNSNYVFNYDHMLDDKGKTAVYSLYAHARICSVLKKSKRDIEELKKDGEIVLDDADELALALHLIRFPEIVEEACNELMPNRLCEYLHDLSEAFSSFYTNCKIIDSAQETSRLLLCEATAVVMRKCFELLGITPVYKL